MNSDVGEGFGVWRLGDDEALLKIVSSANVACGFHAGDPGTMRRVCEMAVERGVAIGAQVGYRDLAGFGRRRIDVSSEDLADDVLYQIGALDGFARAAGGRVGYVRPHGALYNTIVTDLDQAGAVVAAVCSYDRTLPVLGLPGSKLLQVAFDAGVAGVPEAFADRAYGSDGALVPRGQRDALLANVEAVVTRCVQLATSGTLTASDGAVIAVNARSICVHGDTEGAVEMARRSREALESAGAIITRFDVGL